MNKVTVLLQKGSVFLMTEDWRYSDEKMFVRESVLKILLHRFGSELKEDGSSTNTNESIYQCAHDWVSQGNMRPDGVVAYYKAYYG